MALMKMENGKCHNCHEELNLDDENDVTHTHVDDLLGMAIFGSKDTPAKWEGLKIEYQCKHCGEKFKLEKIEY